MSEETPSIAAPEQNAIAETGSDYYGKNIGCGTIHCITIVGQIEGIWNFPHRTNHQVRAPYPADCGSWQTDEIDGPLVLLTGRRRCGSRTCHRRADRGHESRPCRSVLGRALIGVPLAVAAKRALSPFRRWATISSVRL